MPWHKFGVVESDKSDALEPGAIYISVARFQDEIGGKTRFASPVSARDEHQMLELAA